jgi:hypothetical protein
MSKSKNEDLKYGKTTKDKDQPTAIAADDPATEMPEGTPGAVRTAGPEGMRDKPKKQKWDEVDEAEDESFPASDPPAY